MQLISLLVLLAPQIGGEIRFEDQTYASSSIRASNFGRAVCLDGDAGYVTVVGENVLAQGSGGIIPLVRGVGGLAKMPTFGAEPVFALGLGACVDAGHGILASGSTFYGFPGPMIGRGYVWDVSNAATPVLIGMLDVNDPEPSQNTAVSIAVVDANSVLMGSPGHNPAPSVGGSIYLFERGPAGWTQTQKFWPPAVTGAPGVNFVSGSGQAIAYDSGTMVSGSNLLRVDVFDRDATGQFSWVTELLDPNPAFHDEFGKVVAIEDDLIAVADVPRNSGLLSYVYVYRKTNGVWALEASLRPSDGYVTTIPGFLGATTDEFGSSIDIDEGRILIGARRGQHGAVPTSGDEQYGSAYLFEHINGAWTEQYRFWASEEDGGSFFGHDVALDGDTVLISALWGTAAEGQSLGSVFLYDLPFGETTCSGEINSTGAESALEVVGERRVTYGDLELRAVDLPPLTLGLPLASQQASFVVHPGGSQGNLCLGGAISRLLSNVGRADSAGSLVAALDPSSIASAGGVPTAIQPGDTWTFQVWYRDANPMPTSNFTSAVSVTFR